MPIFAYLLGFTPLGRHMRFIGVNREVSRLAGVRVNRIRFGSFVVRRRALRHRRRAGRRGHRRLRPDGVESYLLPVFAAMFLGTAVIQPGRFNPIGTFIGSTSWPPASSACSCSGSAGWVSDVFYGGVLIIAVTISTLLRKRVA